LFRLHDNDAARQLVFFKDFLARYNVQPWSIPHPDLAAADFYLFLGLKSALTGRLFVVLRISLRM
jgi:hypothetical protein